MVPTSGYFKTFIKLNRLILDILYKRGKMIKNKKAAMEMSVGTIVTIVLLMATLVLGLVLIKTIFFSSKNAVTNVNNQIENEITKMFEDEGAKLVIYPSSREITLKKKQEDTPKGFAFAVRNNGVNTKTFAYTVYVQDVTNCGGFTKQKANAILLGASGSFSLDSGEDTIASKDIVKFLMNEEVPLCTMIYRIKVCEGNACTEQSTQNVYEETTIFVTIK
jgi:hypothetical protein